MRIAIAQVSSMPLRDVFSALKTVFPDAKIRIMQPSVLKLMMDGDAQDLIVLPGISGQKSPYPSLFTHDIRDSMTGFVERGGQALGICAGAYFLASHAWYQFDKRNHTLRDTMKTMFQGAASGPRPPGPQESWLKVDGHSPGEIWTVDIAVPGMAETISVPYGLGPAFYPSRLIPQDHEVIASFADISRSPAAAIAAKVGEGQVVATGVLPYLANDAANVALWDMHAAPIRNHYLARTAANAERNGPLAQVA
jgi:glutamine amidotransferase-like uncharacterized protein